MTAAAWTAIAAWLTFAVAVAAAGFAAVQTLVARADRTERLRPQVVVDLQEWPSHHNIVRLRVMNIGQTTARNVHLVFDPPLGAPPAGQEDIWTSMARFAQRTWPYMPPQKSYDCIFVNLFGYPEDAPHEWTVTVHCDDYQHRRQPPELARLDLGDFARMTPVTRDVHVLAGTLEKIRERLDKLPFDRDGLRTITESKTDADTRREARRESAETSHRLLSERLKGGKPPS